MCVCVCLTSVCDCSVCVHGCVSPVFNILLCGPYALPCPLLSSIVLYCSVLSCIVLYYPASTQTYSLVYKLHISAFSLTIGHPKRFPILPHNHPFIHKFTHRRWSQPPRVTASWSGAVRVRRLRDTSTLREEEQSG